MKKVIIGIVSVLSLIGIGAGVYFFVLKDKIWQSSENSSIEIGYGENLALLKKEHKKEFKDLKAQLDSYAEQIAMLFPDMSNESIYEFLTLNEIYELLLVDIDQIYPELASSYVIACLEPDGYYSTNDNFYQLQEDIATTEADEETEEETELADEDVISISDLKASTSFQEMTSNQEFELVTYDEAISKFCGMIGDEAKSGIVESALGNVKSQLDYSGDVSGYFDEGYGKLYIVCEYNDIQCVVATITVSGELTTFTDVFNQYVSLTSSELEQISEVKSDEASTESDSNDSSIGLDDITDAISNYDTSNMESVAEYIEDKFESMGGEDISEEELILDVIGDVMNKAKSQIQESEAGGIDPFDN